MKIQSKINENIAMKYLKTKHYEIVAASDPGKHLVYVPYVEHPRVSRYLLRHNTKHTLRFNHDYSIAIYHL